MGWRWLVLGVLVAGCGASSSDEAPKPPEASSGAEEAAAEPPEPEASEPVAELPELDPEVARRINAMVESGGSELDLINTQVTDAGLVHLSGLTSLRELYLGDTQITDAGLAHLRGLTSLRELDLINTQVTDAGVASLEQALPNCRIIID